MSIWNSEDANLDVLEFYSKVAICLSARAHYNSYCMDLSSTHQFNGSTKAPVCTAWDVKVFQLEKFKYKFNFQTKIIFFLGGFELYRRRSSSFSHFRYRRTKRPRKSTSYWSIVESRF